MKDRRLERGAALLSAVLFAAGCGSAVQNNETPAPTPCVISGELGRGQIGYSDPYVIVNQLPKGRLRVINPLEKKVLPGIASHEVGERITVAHNPKLEVIFEADNIIKYEVACHTNLPMA